VGLLICVSCIGLHGPPRDSGFLIHAKLRRLRKEHPEIRVRTWLLDMRSRGRGWSCSSVPRKCALVRGEHDDICRLLTLGPIHVLHQRCVGQHGDKVRLGAPFATGSSDLPMMPVTPLFSRSLK
jgi:hypothetical protein